MIHRPFGGAPVKLIRASHLNHTYSYFYINGHAVDLLFSQAQSNITGGRPWIDGLRIDGNDRENHSLIVDCFSAFTGSTSNLFLPLSKLFSLPGAQGGAIY